MAPAMKLPSGVRRGITGNCSGWHPRARKKVGKDEEVTAKLTRGLKMSGKHGRMEGDDDRRRRNTGDDELGTGDDRGSSQSRENRSSQSCEHGGRVRMTGGSTTATNFDEEPRRRNSPEKEPAEGNWTKLEQCSASECWRLSRVAKRVAGDARGAVYRSSGGVEAPAEQWRRLRFGQRSVRAAAMKDRGIDEPE